MSIPIRVLVLEDRVADAELMLHELRRAGFEPDWQRVDDEPGYLAALETNPDLILADWSLPQFSGLRALQLLRERGLDFPFIIMSGSIGEEAAVEAMRQGAADYLLKDRPARLGLAVEHALHEKRLRDEKRQAEQTLYESEQKFRSFVEQSEDATVLTDEQGIVIEWNRGAERVFGLPQSDVLGHPLWDIQFRGALPERKTPAVYEQLKSAMLDALKTGQAPWLNRLIEMAFQRPDGTQPTIQTMAFAIPTQGGFRLGSISRDISEHKRMEQALFLMSDTQKQIAHLDSVTDIYHLVGQKIQELIGDGYVVISILDEQAQVMKVLGIYGFGGLYEKLVRTFKLDPTRMTYPLKDMTDDELSQFRSEGLERFEGGLYNLLVRKVPKRICRAVERQLGFTAIYTMSFIWQGVHFGGITLLAKHDIAPYRDMIETIMNQAAITIMRIRSDEQLRQSEAALKKAQQVSHVGSWTWHTRTNRLEWSDEMYSIFGIEKESFSGDLGEVIRDTIHPDDRAAVEQSNLLVIRDRKPTPLEYRVMWPDGTVRTVWGEAGELVLDETDSPLILTGIVQDITERKRAEEALKQRAVQLVLLNDVSRRVAGVMNLDELLKTTASLVHESFGYEHVGIFIADKQQEGDLIMKARAGLYASRFPSNHRIKLGEGMVGWVALYGKRLLSNDVRKEMRFRDPFGDGSIKAELSVPICSELGNVGIIDVQSRQGDAFNENDVMVMETLADVLAAAIHNAQLYQELEAHSSALEQAVKARTEELVRTKDHIEAILNSVGEAIIVFGTDGRIHQVNPTFERLTGYGATDVEMHRYNDPPIAVNLSDDIFRQAHEGHDWHGEMQVRRHDGTTFDSAVSISPVFDEQGAVVALVGAMRDISPLKEVERLKDAFVSNVSHELRTPITSLKLLHHLLEVNPTKQASYLEQLGRVIGRLNVLIEDLLRLSRLDQGRVEMNIVPVDLKALATQYVTDFALLAESKQLTLAIEDSDVEPIARADQGLLGQVLSVLLTNALNYTPAGGRVVLQVLTAEEEGRAWAGFSVSDTGTGISREEQGQLFQRFFRGNAGRESGAAGTGLGLAIAREIVERHGGRIDVVSKGIAGEGATFTAWLPAEDKITETP